VDKKEVIEFFDSFAESWDDDVVRIQWKIEKILDAAGVSEGKAVLDVACGTGVLIPDYINRKVSRCVGIDISTKMIDIAKRKFSEYENISLLCADAETFEFSENFDCIVIYNAFPHFVNCEALFINLAKCLNQGGRITIAHGMSREELIKHHSGRAEKISSVLPEAEELAKAMSEFFDMDIKTSTDEIYIVSGKKR
jgi:demethylmenaquinone methyltransferase/2-methoxy-6-polyprenyl-1,4-benzoquinol methylase